MRVGLAAEELFFGYLFSLLLGSTECDQIGRFEDILGTFLQLVSIMFWPKISPYFLKVVKISIEGTASRDFGQLFMDIG